MSIVTQFLRRQAKLQRSDRRLNRRELPGMPSDSPTFVGKARLDLWPRFCYKRDGLS